MDGQALFFRQRGDRVAQLAEGEVHQIGSGHGGGARGRGGHALEGRVLSQAPPAPLPADLAGDPDQPGGEFARIAERCELAVGPQEDLLGQIRGRLRVPGLVVADGADQARALIVELGEGSPVPVQGASHQGLVGRRHVHAPSRQVSAPLTVLVATGAFLSSRDGGGLRPGDCSVVP